jgi:hypothetical protein
MEETGLSTKEIGKVYASYRDRILFNSKDRVAGQTR